MLDVMTICLSMPFHVNSVNCFLLRTGRGWILIDTACSNKRADLEAQVRSAGCKAGELSLILLTHGDFDHCAMPGTFVMRSPRRSPCTATTWGWWTRGDMFWNRGKGSALIKVAAPLFLGFHPL